MHSPLLQLPNTFRAFYGAFVHQYAYVLQRLERRIVHSSWYEEPASGGGFRECFRLRTIVVLKIFSTIAVIMTVILNILPLSRINQITQNGFQAWQA